MRNTDKTHSGAIDAHNGRDNQTTAGCVGGSARFSRTPPSLQFTWWLFSALKKDPLLRTLQRFATVCFLGAAVAALLPACSSDAVDPPASAGATSAAGASAAGASAAGASGSGTAGAGTAGSGTAGSGAGGSGTAGSGTAGAGTGPTGNAANGLAAYKKSTAACNGCHGEMGEGMGGPNITGSKTAGIGNWTQAQFTTAVRQAKNRSGTMLYALMMPYNASTVSDQDVADIYAFLISKPVETPNPGSYCSGGQCTGSK